MERTDAKFSILRGHPFFRDLDEGSLDQLCRYATLRKYRRGAAIFVKGDVGDSLYAVVSGSVKISSSSWEGRSAILNLIRKGEIFGEIALLDGLQRTTDATAHTSCELFAIDRRNFFPFIEAHPSVAMKIIQLLCTRLRWTSIQAENVMLQDLPGRLASLLIGLTARQGDVLNGSPIAITQQEIGEMVGMTRESINKQLRAWTAKGLVRLDHGSVVVLNAPALAEIAETGETSLRD